MPVHDAPPSIACHPCDIRIIEIKGRCFESGIEVQEQKPTIAREDIKKIKKALQKDVRAELF